MDSPKTLVKQFEKNPQNVGFDELCKVCDQYFGKPRIKGSHYIYKTPWPGDPRINIQNDNEKAKAYQVRQVVKAIKKL
jgi:predicted RNA binding protein YcfA (HicA-like mRNA interferase family)